tara:strand:- start:1452 stop:1646 length:195 start_codon:yes stop_codon:yes gene_type:complete
MNTKRITPKMDFGLVSAINKTMDKNIFVAQKKNINENTLFDKSKKNDLPKNKSPKKKKRNLKKK